MFPSASHLGPDLPPLERVTNPLLGYSVLVPRGVTADLSDVLDGYDLELGGSDRFLLEIGRYTATVTRAADALTDALGGDPPRAMEVRAHEDGVFLVVDVPMYGNQRAYAYWPCTPHPLRMMCIARERDRDAVIQICSSLRAA